MVVDLPAPVGPVTSTSPRVIPSTWLTTCGARPSSAGSGMRSGTMRTAAPQWPRWMKRFTRKCATPGRKKRVSSSRSRSKRSSSAGVRKLSASRRDSIEVRTGLPGSGWSTPATVTITG